MFFNAIRKTNKKFLVILGFAIISIFLISHTLSTFAVFNKQINYQGKLTTPSNIAVADGEYNMEFKLYTAVTGGTAIWTETRTGANRVSVKNGLFSVMLGSVTSLSGVDFNQTLYLGVNIGGSGTTAVWDGEMSPRKILGAVPAAVTAENVGGFLPAQSANGNQIPVLSNGSLILGDTNPAIRSTGVNTLTFQGVGSTGNIQFFGSSNTISSSGNLTLAGTIDALGGNSTNWNTAYSWGNHASAGYLTNGTHWTKVGTSLYYNTGNVGIGTASPNAPLEIKSSMDNIMQLTQVGGGWNYIEFYNDTVRTGYFGMDNNENFTFAPAAGKLTRVSLGDFLVSNGNVNVLAGNLSIGTNNATSPLTVYNSGTLNGTYADFNRGGGAIKINLDAGKNEIASNAKTFHIGTTDANALIFKTNNTERMNIAADGTITANNTVTFLDSTRFQTGAGSVASTVLQNVAVKSYSTIPTGYIKFVTPIKTSNNQMFSIDITGYDYGVGKSIDFTVVGYAYGTSDQVIKLGFSNRSSFSGDVTVVLEDRGAGYRQMVIALGNPTQTWYFQKFAATVRLWSGIASTATPSQFDFVIGESTLASGAWQSAQLNNQTLDGQLGTLTQSGNINLGAAASISIGGGTMLSGNGTLSNAFVGGAGNSTMTGGGNSAFGYAALLNNTTGSNNVAIGGFASQYNTTGGQNVAIGVYSGSAGTTATNNVSMGYQSLFRNTTGGNNTAVGYRAGTGITGASDITGNSLFGYYSGFGLLTSGHFNTMIGYQAGQTTTTGQYNTFLGFQAGYNVTTGSNNIMIGRTVNPVNATDNYKLNIGDTIFGDLANKYIGVNNNAPTRNLDVVGNGAFIGDTTLPLYVQNTNTAAGRHGLKIATASADSSTLSLYIESNGTRTFQVQGDGKIGIGITPTQKLSVGDNISWGANGEGLLTWSSNAVASIRAKTGADMIIASNGGVSSMILKSNGNVGIGTSTPLASLHVVGGTTGSDILFRAGNRSVITGDGKYIWGSDRNNGILSWNTGLAIIGSQAGSDLSLVAGTEKMRILSNGNVGINTTTPEEKLHIQGSWAQTLLSGDSLVIRKPNYSSGGWARNLMEFQEYDGTKLFGMGAYGVGNTFGFGYIGKSSSETWMKLMPNMDTGFSGNVGIKTSTPTEALDVVGNIKTKRLFITESASSAPGITISGSRPNLTFDAQALTGGFAFNIMDAKATNTDSLSSTVGVVGVYGSANLGGNPVSNYMYFGAQPDSSYYNATLKLSSNGNAAFGLPGSSTPNSVARLASYATSGSQLRLGYDETNIANFTVDTSGVLTINPTGGLSYFAGNVQTTGTLKVGAYTLPATDGTAGQALVTNGSGVVAWTSVSGGSVTAVTAGSGLDGGTITTSGTIALNSATISSLSKADSALQPGSVVSSQWTTTGSDIYYNSGNVGIGTDTPVTGLDINFPTGSNKGVAIGGNYPSWVGDNGMYITGQLMASNGLLLGGSPIKWGTSMTRIEGYSDTLNYYIKFITNNIDRLIIDEGGNIGIGTSSPVFPLDVAGGKIGIDSMQAIYLPNQTSFNGSLIIGNGGGNLTSTAVGEGWANTFVGMNSGLAITTGSQNNGIGAYTLSSVTTGKHNNGMGANALRMTTTGNSNTAIGTSALYDNTSGNYNTAIGLDALRYSQTASYNTAIGPLSLQQNTIGINNTGVGFQALMSNTEGSSNVAIGHTALKSNLIGTQNVAIGFETLLNSTASNNVAIGSLSMKNNTTGTFNSAVGYNTLTSNTTGSYNMAFGRNALTFNTTGVDNVAIGADAMPNNTTGIQNLGLGSEAALYNSTGFGNIAIGFRTLHRNKVGSQNTIVGNTAGYGVINGSDIGGNSILGYGAGFALLTGADYNTLIGYKAGDNITTGARNIIIGYNIDAVSVTASDQLNIGNTIYGDLANGRISIANTNNNYTFEVGNITVSGVVARFANSTGTCDINPTSTAMTCSSDITLKKNISLLSDQNIEFEYNQNIEKRESVLENLLALTPVEYNWLIETDDSAKHIGFIAQEVEQLFPSLISTDAKGLKSMNYAGLTPILTQAIKEMDLKIAGIDDMTKTNTWRDALARWFDSAGNGIGRLFVREVRTEMLCIKKSDGTDICLTGDQLENVVNKSTSSTGTTSNPPAPTPVEPDVEPTTDSPLETGPVGDADPAGFTIGSTDTNPKGEGSSTTPEITKSTIPTTEQPINSIPEDQKTTISNTENSDDTL